MPPPTTYIERRPRESERAWLKARISAKRPSVPWESHVLIAAGIGMTCFGLPISMPAILINNWLSLGFDGRWVMAGSFLVGIVLAAVLWRSEVKSGKEHVERFVAACRDALTKSRVESIVVNAVAAYKLDHASEEVDGRSDWGTRYLIRMDDDRAFLIAEVEDFDWPNTQFEVVRTPIGQHIIAINKLGELLPHTATTESFRDRGILPECEPVIVDWDAILTGKADL